MKLITWGLAFCLLCILAVGTWFVDYVATPSAITTDTFIYIPKGSGVRSIKTLLSQKGIIRDDIRFLALARMSGTARHLRSGEYLIPPNLKPLEILHILTEGNVVRHKVTIPEGLTSNQISTILAEKGWIDPQRFAELTHNHEFIASLGINLDSLEGYLFPDTYSLTRGEVTEESIIRTMVNRFHNVWKEVTADMASDLVRNQIIVLASIVEKETAAQQERPLIARVFLNRLEKNMRLQSDPTVIYGIENFSGDLTRDDLRRETPYNTYVIKGLPPGPICNPGKESILAVLRPADAPYLYFVSKNDGTHHFSTRLKEHNRAVRKYQKNRTGDKDKKESADS